MMAEPESLGEFLKLSDEQKMKLVAPQAAREQVARMIVTIGTDMDFDCIFIGGLPMYHTRNEEVLKTTYERVVHVIVGLLASTERAVLEGAAIQAREFSTPFDIDVWRDSTKKEMTARVMLAFADKLHQQAQERTP